MGIFASDVVPSTRARATLSELVEQVKAGAEKIITNNGESYIALIDAERLDDYHRLERERIHLLLIDDVRRGLADIAAGRNPGCRCRHRRAAGEAGRRVDGWREGQGEDQRGRTQTWLSPSSMAQRRPACWGGWRPSNPS